MPKFHEIKVVDLPVEVLFETVMSVEDYPYFLPLCVATHKENEDLYSMTIGFMAFKETYISRVVPNSMKTRIDIHVHKGNFKHFKSYWAFKQLTATTTEVEYFIDFSLNNFILNSALNKAFGLVSHRIMNAFLERARIRANGIK